MTAPLSNQPLSLLPKGPSHSPPHRRAHGQRTHSGGQTAAMQVLPGQPAWYALLGHAQTFTTVHGLIWVATAYSFWSILLLPLLFVLGMHLDETLSPEGATLGTLFSCITVTKLGSFVYFTFLHRLEADILVVVFSWLTCHAISLAAVRTLGQRLLNHQFYAVFCALGLGTAGWELFVGGVWWPSCVCVAANVASIAVMTQQR